MKLTKNIRISLYILIPIILWMASGLFKNDRVVEAEEKSEFFSVQTIQSFVEAKHRPAPNAANPNVVGCP